MVILHQDLLLSSILPVALLNFTRLIGWGGGWKRALIGSAGFFISEDPGSGLTPGSFQSML